MDTEKTLSDVEQQIKDLKHEYELFFAGEIRIEPQKQRKELQHLIRSLTNQHLTNTGLKFRFLSVQATFSSYQRLWDRILIEIEKGSYEPHRFKADYHVGKIDKKTGQVVESEVHRQIMRHLQAQPEPADEVKQLYREFVQARRVTAEPGSISFDSFKKSLETQIPVLKKRLGEQIKFKVSIENGKAKLKGVKA